MVAIHPFFGLIWQFIVVTRIANSIQGEIASRQDDSILGLRDASAVEELSKRPTFGIGIAYCTLITTAISLYFITSVDIQSWFSIVRPFFSLAGMICWIIYWVRLSRDKRKLVLLPV